MPELPPATPLADKGCWVYPDMMMVGMSALKTAAWERAHFGAWCIVSSPLTIGFDVTDTALLDSVWPTISNQEAIAVNQNWAGHPGWHQRSWTPAGEKKVTEVVDADGEAVVQQLRVVGARGVLNLDRQRRRGARLRGARRSAEHVSHPGGLA